MKQKIGVFLHLNSNQIVEGEGILEYLLHLFNSSHLKNSIVIALPRETRAPCAKILEKAGIQNIEFLVGHRIPPPLFTYRLIQKKRAERKARKKNIPQTCRFSFTKTLMQWMITSYLGFFLGPFLLVALKTPWNLLKTCSRKLKSPWISFWNNPHRQQRIQEFLHTMYLATLEEEIKQLIKKINHRSDIHVWLIPHCSATAALGIQRPKVFNVHDIVFHEFPSLFSDLIGVDSTLEQIQKVLSSPKNRYICYSAHVRSQHLLKYYPIDSSAITIIKHAATNLSPLLTKPDQDRRTVSIHLLEKYQKKHLQNDPYLRDFHLPSMRFIFYASQVRPHKNCFHLIKAYEKLLREKFTYIKLVMTGLPSHQPSLAAYIQEKGLQHDVLVFHHISREVLAALNHLALCAVNPTLFEGGFPFTFSEAYSVGTPSIMSRIPVVEEEIRDEALKKRMLFNPLSVEDMVEKILWGLEHREELKALQKPLYDQFASRTWDHVAQDYQRVLTRASFPLSSE